MWVNTASSKSTGVSAENEGFPVPCAPAICLSVYESIYIPFVVDELIKEGKADCQVLPTESSWFGVTYREDKPHMVAEIGKLVAAGAYPAKLF